MHLNVNYEVEDDDPQVQATAAAPPADRLQRQKFLEELAEEGLPVKRTPRGFLQPIQG